MNYFYFNKNLITTIFLIALTFSCTSLEKSRTKKISSNNNLVKKEKNKIKNPCDNYLNNFNEYKVLGENEIRCKLIDLKDKNNYFALISFEKNYGKRFSDNNRRLYNNIIRNYSATIQEEFNEAKKNDNLLSYQLFLYNYKNNQNALNEVSWVKKRLKELDDKSIFEDINYAKRNDTIYDYLNFIKKYESNNKAEKHVLWSKKRISEIEFSEAINNNSINLYKNFIKKYKNQFFANEMVKYCSKEIIKIEYENVLQEKDNTTKLQLFLDKYINNPLAFNYAKKIEKIIHERDYLISLDEQTIKQYKNYLNKWGRNKDYSFQVSQIIIYISTRKTFLL